VYGVKPSHVRGPYQPDLRTRGAEVSLRIGDPICNLSRLNADGRIGQGGHVLATPIRRSVRSGGAIRPPEEW
jgi:hypothetical protein